jgi:hypothetical protein
MVAKLGTGPHGKWRLAKTLIQLEKQVDAKYPQRLRTSDGSIGDEDHQTRTSDHNAWIKDPDGHLIVSAIDLTHDPAHGFDSYKFADMLLKQKDPRVKYIISNRRIGSGPAGQQPGVWRQYNGSNAHKQHVHISVEDEKARYDSTAEWKIDDLKTAPPPAKPKLVHPVISLGMTSKDVPYIHTILGMKPYEFFGNSTMRALQNYQIKHGLPPTGIADSATWALFEADKPYV